MTTPADTLGWDTVSAIRVDDANAEIIRQKRSPATFAAALADGSASVTGTFGDWQIASGDGEEVHLSLPIPSASVVSGGATGALSGTATINVRLVFVKDDAVPTPPSTGTGTSTSGSGSSSAAPSSTPATPATPTSTATETGSHNLQVSPMPGVADLVTMAYDNPPDFDTQTAFEACLQQWLDDGIGAFDHVFAAVDIGREAAIGDFAWMQPSQTGYAYAAGVNGVDLIGVLATTGTRTADSLPRQLSPAVVPDGARAGILIAPARLLEEVVRPLLVAAFPGSATTDFTLSTDGLQLSLNAAVSLKKRTDNVDTPGRSDTYIWQPILETMTVRFEESRLTFESETQSTISPGILSHGRHRVVYELAITSAKGGGKTIAFQLDPGVDPVSDHWTTQTEGMSILKWVELGAGIIAMIALTILTDGAVLFFAGMGLALLQGVASVVPQILELEGTDDAPNTDALLLDACGGVSWQGGQVFSLTEGDLSGGLRLGGTLTPAPATPAKVPAAV